MSINKIILVILLLGGGTFWWIKHTQTKRYEQQVASLATYLDEKWFAPETAEAEVNSNVMKSLLAIQGYREMLNAGKIKKPADEYVRDAVRLAAPSTSVDESDQIAKAFLENLSVCERSKILNNDEQVRAMSAGNAPVIQAGGYKGEKLILIRKIPVQLARTAVNHPANLALVPESAGALIWPYTANDYVLGVAQVFNKTKIIEGGEFDDVKKRNDEFRNLTFK